MNRCIDADALMRALAEMWYDSPISVTGISVSELINKQPTIDIVRCKECKYYEKFPTWATCTYWSGDPYEQAAVNDNDFCSYGERKESE